MNQLIQPNQPAQPDQPASLRIDALSKRFADLQALDAVSFRAAPGEIIAICGPSGAGKSTLARLISGLEQADAGTIELGPRQLLQLAPQQRRVAHMFESYALYPTLSVYDNIASPLRSPVCRGQFSVAEIAARVRQVMELTEIAVLSRRKPSELSGGQKQRVALCRTLVQSPALFILDEPIGHLDAKLRHKLRGEIRRRQRALPQATLWLTPDAVEAMAVADRVVMLIDGQVRQIDTPDAIYLRPADVDVARLVGDPAMNLLRITLDASSDGMRAVHAGGSFVPALPLQQLLAHSGLHQCTLGFAPLHTTLRLLGSGHATLSDEIAAVIYSVEPFGKFTLVTVDAGGVRLRAKCAADFRADVGSAVAVRLAPQQLTLFDAAGARQTTQSNAHCSEPVVQPEEIAP